MTDPWRQDEIDRHRREEIEEEITAPLKEALRFYADPDSYFAIAVFPGRSARAFADDLGCVIGPHGDHDHRHGRKARKVLGDEWWGTEPCEEMLKLDEERST